MFFSVYHAEVFSSLRCERVLFVFLSLFKLDLFFAGFLRRFSLCFELMPHCSLIDAFHKKGFTHENDYSLLANVAWRLFSRRESREKPINKTKTKNKGETHGFNKSDSQNKRATSGLSSLDFGRV